MSPIGRILQRLIHEVLVNHLANSPSFQRMALRVDAFLMKQQTLAQETAEKAKRHAEELIKEQAKNVQKSPEAVETIEFVKNSEPFKQASGFFRKMKAQYDKEFEVKGPK